MNYKLFPIPHKISYLNETVVLTEPVNLVMSEDLDEATQIKIQTVLEDAAIDYQIGQTRTVDRKNVVLKLCRFIPDNFDAYQLVIEKSGVQINGLTSEAVFHGISTLKQILKQADLKKVRQLAINDYADIEKRGFIEGFYGNPWTNEQRIDLMKFGGDIKLNQYVFAPKDDPYHNKRWRELYPSEKLASIAQLARVGEETKVRFTWTIHPFMNDPIRFDQNYATDLNIIQQKFTQLINIGVTSFGILADDAPQLVNGEKNYVNLVQDISKFLEEKQSEFPNLDTNLLFVPHDYYSDGTLENGQNELQALNERFPENVHLTITGGKVFGSVNNDFLNKLSNNLKTEKKDYQPVQFWVNWPVNDGSRDNLIMGGADYYLQKSIDSKKLYGIMLNPMMQANVSKVAIFMNANYAWDIWQDKYTAEVVEYNSFNYIENGDFETSNASLILRRLSQYMQYNAAMPELKLEGQSLVPVLNEFFKDLQSNNLNLERIKGLQNIFSLIEYDAGFYRSNGQVELRSEMEPWLSCAIDQMRCLSNILNFIETGSSDTLIKANYYYYKSKNHSFKYLDELKNAEFGSQSIIPFLDKLMKYFDLI